MSNDVIIPDDLQGPSTYFRDHNIQTERLGDGLDGSGFTIIGVQGKEFYLKHKGKRYTLINPKSNPPTPYDGQAATYFDFVILRKAARKSHTYYEAYKKGAEERPICQSTDGIAPDDSVPPFDPVTGKGKQADLCDLCPRHEWKTQANGREGRECADNLRLAVLPMEPQMVALLGEPIHEACFLRIPAASLTALADLGDMMRKRFGPDTPYCNHILRITFKQKVEWPQFEYRVVRFLSNDECALVNEIRETPQAYRILGLTPEGQSLVRRESVFLASQAYIKPLSKVPAVIPGSVDVAMQQAALNQTDVSAMAEKLAAERAARIAAARGQTIEGEIVKPPSQPVATPAQAPVSTPVPDTAAEIDAMIAEWRPKPPGA